MSEHAREVMIVGILVAACLVATFLEAHELGAMLGGAACALVVPRAGTMARSGVVLGAVVLASTLQGCGGTPLPARATCRGAAAIIAAACDFVPETIGEEPQP